ncbi:MAG TPA: glycosyltransferase family A protein [Sphingomicrobium sp.]|nr:glycosyltransferase family A protein [Sphingomicrobium sp.]
MSSDPINFSVVIPLYNKGPHVERAILSVLEQDHPAAEIIVVDDGSTDGGLEIVRGFKGVKVLRRPVPGPGGYAARNLGIVAASTEWIAFLDADDRWRPDHLSTLAAAIAKNDGQVGCAFTRPTFVTDGTTRPYPISKVIRTSTKPLDLHGFVAAWLHAKTCPMWTGAVAVRRSVLLAAGMFPANAATRGGDKDVWLRVMARTNGIFVPKVTAEFHQDTVNRVTKSLDHTVQPIICRSIARLLQSARPGTQSLLKRLHNMEVVYYARYAAGAGAPFNRDSLNSLCAPALRSTVKIMSFAMAGSVLRLLRSPRFKPAAFNARVAAEPVPATSPSVCDPASSRATTVRPSRAEAPRAWIGVAARSVPERRETDLPVRLSA